MIDIKAPHMGLNDERAPVRVQMWNTWEVSKDENVEKIVGWTAQVAKGAPGGKLKELVISCHGAPAYLQLGKGVSTSDLGLFASWKGLVEKIWVRACLVGRIVGPDTASQGDGAFIKALGFTGNGDTFLRRLAKETGAYVVAGTELQSSNAYSRTTPCPFGKLDQFEGLVLSYPPDGGAANWSKRYPSVYNADPKALTAVNPNSE
ncbi:hypothetical protein D3874_22160 [Oleomonas cavernae]|uniref:DUF4347 domain-containing protein n=1 Tax=Oleomonas cavernae TaxID=2320859 RepID=A0A418WHA2_9PROT|nr:hypothetical protein [Oleomonas cavernae]RJF89342.1 hypothetical protein D3874_22160 [Oleomonas cavernae]